VVHGQLATCTAGAQQSLLIISLHCTLTSACAADKCAWTFGTTYITGSGAKANMKLGAYDYLIQQVGWLVVAPSVVRSCQTQVAGG
jgi:hypothetical protein